jgi:hypothetical protein
MEVKEGIDWGIINKEERKFFSTEELELLMQIKDGENNDEE